MSLPKQNETERAVFKALRAFYLKTGYMPTARELAQDAGVHFSRVPVYLMRLEKRGFIERDSGLSPRIRILHDE